MSIFLISVPKHLKKSKILHLHFFQYKTAALTYIVTKGKNLADISGSYIRFFHQVQNSSLNISIFT